MAVCQELGMETDNSAIPSIASGFAGGIGNTGSVCGAVIGAVMAIGLRQGRAGGMKEMLANLEVAGEFRRRFEAEVGNIDCRELVGYDLSTRDGLRKFMVSDKPRTACFPAVSASYRIAMDLLRDIPQPG